MRLVGNVGFLSLLCALFCARAAFAGDPSPPGELATEWLVKGNTAFREGRFAEAEEAYRAAFAIKKGYDIAGNLGAAELAQGKHRQAAGHLAFTLRLFPITGDPAVRERMQRAFERARREVGAVRVETNVKGAAISVDGAAQGDAPLADEVFVDPGEHVFEAKLDGFRSAPVRATVERGGTAEVAIPLRPIVAERVRVVRDTQSPSRPRSLVPAIAMGSAGVVGIGTGIALFVASAAKKSSAEGIRSGILDEGGSCVTGAGNHDGGRCPDLKSTLRSHDALRGAATGAVVVGSAAVAGAAAYLLWPDRRPRSTGRELRVTPSFGQSGSAVMVSGAF